MKKKLIFIISSILIITIVIVSIFIMNANKTTDIYLITYNNSENETKFVTSVHSDDITYFIPIHQNAIIKDDVFSEVSKKAG